MSVPSDNSTDINCFTQLDLNNINKDLMHSKIKEYRQNMKSAFEDEKLFEEIMPTIQKQTQMNNIYQALIKNGLKYNSQIIRLIYRTISNINMRTMHKNIAEKKKERKDIYHLPKIEMLKTKKEKYENDNIKKIRMIKLNKEKLEEYKSKMRKRLNISLNTINESAKIKNSPKLYFQNYSSISNNSVKYIDNYEHINFRSNDSNDKSNLPKSKSYLSINKDLITTPSNISVITPSTNISNNIFSKKILRNNSYTMDFNTEIKNNDSFILSNISKKFDIIHKCNQEVKKGNNNSKNLHRYKKEFDKSIHQKINNEDFLDLDHKVLEERNKLVNKYSLLEENNIRTIKKELKEKISNNFAYQNRKEFGELLKVDKNAHAYNIQLREMDFTNKKILKRLDLERKKINRVKIMADDELCRSIVINKKMDEINEKNRQIKILSLSKKVLFPEKFLIPKVKNFGLKGDLVPTIIHIRKSKMKSMGKKHKKYWDII